MATRRSTLDFLRTEAAFGSALALAALAAIFLANSPYAPEYFHWVHAEHTLQVGAFVETKTTLKWIKEGLMAVFFFVVGLEIKYEILRGELSSLKKLGLPVLAAVGGMAAPALVFLSLNMGEGGVPTGWPIPTATDIAFALAALAIAAPKLPGSLRIFLLTLAIADDLGAVALIALLFSSELNLLAILGALVALAAMAGLGKLRQGTPILYAIGFLIVWAFTLKSGVNTSLAGVAAALTVPIGPNRAGEEGMVKHFLEGMHPYVAWGILPLFAFAAAGFSFGAMEAGHLLAPLPLGIALGLLIGKPVGIMAASALAVALRIGQRPTGATWLELFGVSLLCGVGFTMSLFIGGLAFPAGEATAQVQLGVIGGSILSIIAGAIVLRLAQMQRR
ncbi:MAG TPA: Na+/H+ antiporter NhaA [Caulobacteraceae bacterium]|nr:Na+/H+ antiporter NhaA [Caulobacteraceae bacterium]